MFGLEIGFDVPLAFNTFEWLSWKRTKYALRVPAMVVGCTLLFDDVVTFVVAVGLLAMVCC